MIITKKKIIIGVSALVGVTLLVGGGIGIKKYLDYKNAKTSYYDVLTSAINADLGYYRYTFSVRTSEVDGNGEVEEVLMVEDLEGLENSEGITEDGDTEADVTAGSSTSTDSWNNVNNIYNDYSELKNYDIKIEGNTTSLEPLTSEFTVTLTTEYATGVFTDVQIMDGIFYVNLGQIKTWLKNSGEQHLYDLSLDIPDNTSYITFTEDELILYSGYAEDSEISVSTITDYSIWSDRLLCNINICLSLFKSVVGDTGHTMSDGSATIVLSSDKTEGVLSKIKTLANTSGDTYDSFITTLYNNDLYTESQYSQAVNEKDNFMYSVNDFMVALNTLDLSDLNLVITGQAKEYTNGGGNTALEADMNYSFNVDGLAYEIEIDVIRTGDNNTITPITSNSISVSTLPDTMILQDTLVELIEYLNFTNIDLTNQLEVSIDSLKEYDLEVLCYLVNEAGVSEEYITLNNVESYIQNCVNNGSVPTVVEEYMSLHDYDREIVYSDIIVQAGQ